MPNSNIYTVSGSVLANEGLYIPRSADDELLGLCRAGAFAYVLMSRQAGKSSLMDRTVERLEEEGVCSIVIDLQGHGVIAKAEQWYYGLLAKIEEQEQINLKTDIKKWWREHENLPVAQRLILFFKTVLLAEVKPEQRVVVFVDEIDTTLGLGFTDDFFASIRYMYSARPREPEFKRLSFVLIGVATPGDLISDPKRTPFNIGQRVELTDFTYEEARPLAAGLDMPSETAQRVLRHVLDWTGGHPCLTQRLCKAIADKGAGDWKDDDVDRVVAETFFGARSREDDHLLFVRDMLTKRAGKLREGVLTTYRNVLRGKHVPDEERSLVKSFLKLSGVVRHEDGALYVRNAVYRHVFNEAFLKENLLTNWGRVAARGIAALVILGILVSAVLAPYAWAKKRDAEAAQHKLEDANQEIRASLEREQSARVEAEQRRVDAEVAGRELESANRQIIESLRNEQSARAEAEKQRLLAEQRRSEAEGQRRAALVARDAAAVAAVREREAKDLAEKRRIDAEQARAFALEAQALAERERMKAEQARDEAEDARREADELRKFATAGQLGALAELTRTQSNSLTQRSAQIAYEAFLQGEKAPPIIAYQAFIQSLMLLPRQVAQLGQPNNLSHSPVTSEGKLKALSYSSFTPEGRHFVMLTREVKEDKPSAAENDDTYNLGSNTVWILDIANNKVTESKLEGWVQPSATTGNVKYLVMPRADGTGTLLIVNTVDGREISRVKAEGKVHHVSVSPGGTFLAAASGNKVVQIWNLVTGDEVRIKTVDSVSHVYLNADGRYLAAVSNDSGDKKIKVAVWDAGTMKMVASVSSPAAVKEIVFSPNAQFFFIKRGGERVGSWRLYETIGGTPLLSQYERYINDLIFSPDGNYLAVSVNDGVGVRLMPVRKGATPMALRGLGIYATLCFSPDGTHLAVNTGLGRIEVWSSENNWREETVTIYEPTGSKMLTSLDEPETKISMAFSPDNKYLATARASSIARVWKLKSGARFRQLFLTTTEEYALIFQEDSVKDVNFSPDGRFIATTGESAFSRIWALHDEERFISRPVQDNLLTTDFSPDGRFMATVDNEVAARSPKVSSSALKQPSTRLRVWDTAQQYNVVLERVYEEYIGEVAFSADGKHLAVLKNTEGTCDTVQVWTLQEDGPIWRVGRKISVNQTSILAISLGGEYVATSGTDEADAKNVSIWKVADFDSDEEKTRCGINNRRTRILHLEADVDSLVFSPDGKYLIVASNKSNTAILFNIPAGKETPIVHRNGINTVAFSPGGKYLATASQEIQVLELSTERVMRLNTDEAVYTLAFSPDGRYLASGDKAARIWDLSGGRQVARLSHGEKISWVTFDNESKYLATLTDSSMRVLDIASEREIARITRNRELISGGDKISFTSDGKYLNEAFRSTARAWLWRLSDLLKERCGRLTVKEPSPEEWVEYVGKELQGYLSPTQRNSPCKTP